MAHDVALKWHVTAECRDEQSCARLLHAQQPARCCSREAQRDEDDFADMALDAAEAGDGAGAGAAKPAQKQQAAKAKAIAKKVRRKKVHRLGMSVGVANGGPQVTGRHQHQACAGMPLSAGIADYTCICSLSLLDCLIHCIVLVRRSVHRQAPRKSAALFEATRDVAATIAEAPAAGAGRLAVGQLRRAHRRGALGAGRLRRCSRMRVPLAVVKPNLTAGLSVGLCPVRVPLHDGPAAGHVLLRSS